MPQDSQRLPVSQYQNILLKLKTIASQPKADLNQRKCIIRSSPASEPYHLIVVRYNKETLVLFILNLEATCFVLNAK